MQNKKIDIKSDINPVDIEKKELKLRNPYYDFLKGIAIIFVVSIHTFDNVYNYENLSLVVLFIRQILNCAVPIFCVSSAFFLSGKDFDIRTNWKKVLKQIIRVYVPYLCCSFPYLFIDIYKGKNVLISILKYFSCSYSVYYFVALIIQFYILLAVFKKNIFRYKILSLLISFSYWCFYVYFIKQRITLPIIIYAGLIIGWFVFFSLGIYFAENKNVQIKVFIPILITILAVCISSIEAIILTNKSHSLAGCGIKPTAILYSVCMMFVLFGCKFDELYRSYKFNKIFEVLGKYSYGIYLTHIFVLETVRKVFIKYISTQVLILNWIILLLVVLFITFIVLFIIKVLSKKVAKYGFGVI